MARMEKNAARKAVCVKMFSTFIAQLDGNANGKNNMKTTPPTEWKNQINITSGKRGAIFIKFY